jgi:hypothetical protein
MKTRMESKVEAPVDGTKRRSQASPSSVGDVIDDPSIPLGSVTVNPHTFVLDHTIVVL